MACGPKEYRAHAAFCLRRAQTVRNPILAEQFEKLAHSWLRLAKVRNEAKCVGNPLRTGPLQDYFDSNRSLP
jgi:hypothetical protein